MPKAKGRSRKVRLSMKMSLCCRELRDMQKAENDDHGSVTTKVFHIQIYLLGVPVSVHSYLIDEIPAAMAQDRIG